MYGDNAGEYRAFKLKVTPAATLAYNKQLTDFWSLRANVGAQILNSGGFDALTHRRVINWGNQDQAFDFTGIAYFADITPIFITNPNSAGMVTSTLQFYAGLGLGYMYVEREQQVLKNGMVLQDVLVRGDIVESSQSSILPYIPLRLGISTNLEYSWDYALEFCLFTALNSELDGNILQTKTLRPDMMGQIQITVKRYIGWAW